MGNFNNRLRSSYLISAFALAVAAPGGPTLAAGGGKTSPSPVLQVNPNPIQAGSIAVTEPVVSASGLSAGKQYYVGVSGGYDETIATMLGSWVTADRYGKISWIIQSSSSAGIPDIALYGPETEITLSMSSKNGSWTQLSSTTLYVLPVSGSASVSPDTKVSGLFNLSGSDAPPLGNLRVMWYDAAGCSCSMFGCSGCTWTEREEFFSANYDGTFATWFTPGPNDGYCAHQVTVQDMNTADIVANTEFNVCK